MHLVHSRDFPPTETSPRTRALIETVSEAQLRTWVNQIALPRHFTENWDQNRRTADWLVEKFETLGFSVQRQGDFSNIIAYPPNPPASVILVGAHYDSVPGSPGADDNASAVAALLGCAVACSNLNPAPPVVFVAFNREEEALAGSSDFVNNYLPTAPFTIECAHILEMLGYAPGMPGSQRVPAGLPIDLGDRGDFLGLLVNDRSANILESIISRAATYTRELPVTGLQVVAGAERVLPVLARSDHVPFWRRDIPAVMWTDTAEFRNPHYHQPTDTPETLNYHFLKRVTQLLTASIMDRPPPARFAPAICLTPELFEPLS
ncbi:MAG TPA: M28 family peptidase [Verrucomicrobiae bacterium]|nr:M28 family peptidase [Verrucomicrobiae bacterium]